MNMTKVLGGENVSICKYCNREYKCGRSLGGHIRTHKITKFSTNYRRPRRRRRRRDSCSSPLPHTTKTNCHTKNNNGIGSELSLLLLLCGWKVHKKRGKSKLQMKRCYKRPKSKEIEGVEQLAQEEEIDQDYSDGDDERDFMKEFGFSDCTHQILRACNGYVCLTCNIAFPTFHALRYHVYQVENESNSMNRQVFGISKNPPKLLDLDLNELPPMEEDII